MNQKTRELVTMHKAPKDDKDWLYVLRKEGRILASIENCVDASIQVLKDYIK